MKQIEKTLLPLPVKPGTADWNRARHAVPLLYVLGEQKKATRPAGRKKHQCNRCRLGNKWILRLRLTAPRRMTVPYMTFPLVLNAEPCCANALRNHEPVGPGASLRIHNSPIRRSTGAYSSVNGGHVPPGSGSRCISMASSAGSSGAWAGASRPAARSMFCHSRGAVGSVTA